MFLDEIGELDGAIQVKLLRVLQSREFQRIGETTPRRFAGKLIAATHRDLQHEMHTGRFRADLYYRICADLICTPPLREQLTDAPGRIAGAATAQRLARRAEGWVCTHLGRNYAWPGNMRELAPARRAEALPIRPGWASPPSPQACERAVPT